MFYIQLYHIRFRTIYFDLKTLNPASNTIITRKIHVKSWKIRFFHNFKNIQYMCISVSRFHSSLFELQKLISWYSTVMYDFDGKVTEYYCCCFSNRTQWISYYKSIILMILWRILWQYFSILPTNTRFYLINETFTRISSHFIDICLF
jgi:hypothetical protein